MTTARKKKNILVVTGTRAEYGLLRPIMREIQKSKKLTLEVLVTGMHTLTKHGETMQEIRHDRMPIVSVVPVGLDDTMTDALSKEIAGIGEYCAKNRPDLIVVLGDRDESFAGAIVGGHLGIPVAHIHGGDKTGLVVDEYIRHATTKFAHLHFAATKASARRIKLLGEELWRVFVVGGPGLDELRSLKTLSKKDISMKYKLSAEKSWHVVLMHPVALDKTSLKNQIAPLLKEVSVLKGEKIILYPNADTGSHIFIAEIEKYRDMPGVHIFQHIPRVDLIALLKNATLLIGNSSMGIIDASYLRIPTVNVGSRQAFRERGANVIDAGYDTASIVKAIRRVSSASFKKKLVHATSPYGDGKTAPRIARIIEKNINKAKLFHKTITYV